ncbi:MULTISPECIES: hypothetical protein [unclassified Gordonia (in: high G+C Gram-positive bacteria)]|uniref:hypothetical protein n=1 Tax=unclassified Gordonia (in: high G+C Gram-positive bacteria) TaxID=2657482 RepID=UPI00071D7741|nr:MULTISPECIES: hypothetical protein [unclassified Gordonia (in: high G+C Gram-positive bacteria)]KSU53328.1 hypothetical protein AS181_22105 [Gordonia sp. SGD-V-85]SCC56071.1 hypothetical protein GA0061091_12720 [Gordonia sp. v-85]
MSAQLAFALILSMAVLLVVVAGFIIAVTDAIRDHRAQDASAQLERVRVRRVEHDAEQQIRTLTSQALAAMLQEARSTTEWPDGEWRRP